MKIVVVGLLLAVLGGAFAVTLMSSPLPVGATTVTKLPDATPPPEMSLAAIPSGTMESLGAFTYRGGDFKERKLSMAAILVRHPKGDVLFDSGLGSKVHEHFKGLPLPARIVSKLDPGTPVRARMEAKGYDLTKLTAIYPTHAHWDHVSGLVDFPSVPVFLSATEKAFVDGGSDLAAVMREIAPKDLRTYAFEGGAYMGFAKSHDLYGDGSIVIVEAPGHTPGSVIVFITTPDGKRYALIGDITWQIEGVNERAEKPLAPRLLVENDAEAVRGLIVTLNALSTRFPELVIVPAHDGAVLARLPSL